MAILSKISSLLSLLHAIAAKLKRRPFGKARVLTLVCSGTWALETESICSGKGRDWDELYRVMRPFTQGNVRVLGILEQKY